MNIMSEKKLKHHTFNALVVDDEEDLNDIMKELLFETGYFRFIIQAKDGSEAWQKMTKQDFDVIVLDLDMPRKNGLELLQMWSNESNYDPRRVIIYSGNLDNAKIHVASKKYNVKNFMVKPFDDEDFAKKVKSILELPPLTSSMKVLP